MQELVCMRVGEGGVGDGKYMVCIIHGFKG